MHTDISVNDVKIPLDAVRAEAAHHRHESEPEAAAARALAVRELLLQRARELGLEDAAGTPTDDECDAIVERLLELEAPVPEPTEEECLRYYERNAARFKSPELIEVAHILFAVTPGADLETIRTQAESTLARLTAAPERFAVSAASLSNCPSGAQGGQLGQVRRGDLVPEFEQAVFGSEAVGILPRLVSTRFGFHVVRVERRVPGRRLDYATAREGIAQWLSGRVRSSAACQYVRMLAGRARLEGVDVGAASSPLVQ
jgi:peptidyl-prolyl cis-trans isomerase C